ncbi:MAG: hypothetical protein AB1630_11550, partial [bacterium]
MKKWVVLGIILGINAEASYHKEPPNYEDFKPILWYEQDHGEFPIDYYYDDNNVENNREHYVTDPDNDIGSRIENNQDPKLYLYGGKDNGYKVKLLCKDKDGDPFWVLQYHYYMPRNTYYRFGGPRIQTHEHDWEWVDVIVLEDRDGYSPLLASSGSHQGTTNTESFIQRKYGGYLGRYIGFTQNGRFGLLGTEDKRAIFYVGNDGNAMYGTRWKLNKIEPKRKMRFGIDIIGRDSIDVLGDSIRDFGNIRVESSPPEDQFPRVFYGGDPANSWLTRWYLYSGDEIKDREEIYAPWARGETHWNNPFPLTNIDVPDTIPPVVRKLTIRQNKKVKYQAEWIEEREEIGPNKVEVVKARSFNLIKNIPVSSKYPLELELEFGEDLKDKGTIAVFFGKNYPFDRKEIEGKIENNIW